MLMFILRGKKNIWDQKIIFEQFSSYTNKNIISRYLTTIVLVWMPCTTLNEPVSPNETMYGLQDLLFCPPWKNGGIGLDWTKQTKWGRVKDVWKIGQAKRMCLILYLHERMMDFYVAEVLLKDMRYNLSI